MKEKSWTLIEKYIAPTRTFFNPEKYFKYLPEKFLPYLYLSRVDKPIGTWLVYFPGAMSLCLAAPTGCLPDIYYLGLFGAGAFLVRGAGCIINDLWDQDVDKEVERTKNRPLANGTLTRNQGIASLAVHLSLALAILLSLNVKCIIIGVTAMLPIIVYPLAKRYIDIPQAVLGLTINIGALMGYPAITGDYNWAATLPLFFGCAAWTLYYDTMYALQDIEDDAKVGIKSIPLYLLRAYREKNSEDHFLANRIQAQMDETQTLQRYFYRCILLYGFFMFLECRSVDLGTPYYIAVLAAVLKMVDHTLALQTIYDYSIPFKDARNVGLIILLGIILGKLVLRKENSEEEN